MNEQSRRVPVLIFCEDEFSRVRLFANVTYAHGFSLGVQEGAELYGAGSCGAYVYPEEEPMMRECEAEDQIERAIAEYNAIMARVGP